MPKVSVVVPVYNVEEYLPRCIESILNQTFTDFELILVDDGSPDNSGEICDEYSLKDERIKVIHKENVGVSSARNTGIEMACGEYLMFVDSDDYVDCDMLSDMFLCCGSDFIVSGLRYVDVDGKVIKEGNPPEIDKMDLREFIEKYYIDLEKKYILSGPINKLFKKSILTLNNIMFNKDLSICEDGLFVVDYLRCCSNVSCINKCYYNYVQYDNNTLMHRYNDNAIEAAEILFLSKRNLFDNCKNCNELYDYVDKNMYYLFESFFLQIYTRSGLSNKEKYKKAKEVFTNSTFVNLTKKIRRINLKTILFKFTAYTQNALLLHCVCCIYFR